MIIGSELIDTQHKKLVELIGSISDHESQSDEASLREVLSYAVTHFSAEENLMAMIGYPGLGTHKNKHKKLMRTLMAYKKLYDAGENDLYSFKHFMFRWVRDHIMDEDKKISIFLQSRNQGQSNKFID